jgi:BirA family biotin operon repressor/biotin-[acetyl-CoA-carboxylase] ligase
MTLRDKIIYMLVSKKGEFVSGQEIAKSEGVSRSAVAKCVNSLKDDGFDITSVNNLGHRLNKNVNMLSEGAIRAYLNDNEIDIRVFQTIDSTNTEAKRAITGGLVGNALFVADEQTAGRGRRGRKR